MGGLRRWIPVLALCVAVTVALSCARGHSDDGNNNRNVEAESQKLATEKADLHRILDAAAERYSMFAQSDATEPLKILCVLRWANLTRGSVDGATYIWIDRGRPVAVACCYPWEGTICDNFQSLGRTPIQAKRDGKVVWQPKVAGVEFQRVPAAPAPADSAAARLRQMKTLARGFNATLVGWAPGDPDREELRLLSQPVYRYETDQTQLLDGALFAIVQGTDPEVLLMLEAHPVKSGATDYEWQFALARRTSGSLEVQYGNQTVWKAAKNPEWRDPTLAYFQLSHPQPPENAGLKLKPDAK